MQKTYQSAGEITRRIGGTNYRVKIHFQTDAKENMQEKVLRLIQNDLDFSEQKDETSFDTLIAEYEKEQAEVKALAETEQVQLDAYEADTDKVAHFLALAKKYTDFTELTPQMIYEFVDKILVHTPEKIDGERTQEVEIYLKYIGKFDVPIQETQSEENPEAEKKRKQRKYHREYQQKRKQAKLAAEAASRQKSA